MSVPIRGAIPGDAPLIAPAAFVGLGNDIVHLCAGGEGPVPRAAMEAVHAYAADKGGGARGRRRLEERVAEARIVLGRRLGLPFAERRLGFAASVSHAMDLVARVVLEKPGEVVLPEDEFPSLPLALTSRRAGGTTLRFVASGPECEERLAAAIGGGTRAVFVSHVSYLTGRRLDLAPVAEACRAVGAALVVDVSHSAGVIGLPVDACDVIVSCCHKFLLGMHGVGFIYWNEERLGRLPVVAPGWNSVQRYAVADGDLDWEARAEVRALEAGNPNFGSLYGLKAALDLVEAVPLPDVERHALRLAGDLRRAVSDLGLPLWTPLPISRAGSSVAIPCKDAAGRGALLAERNILVTAGEGRLRLSFHLHNGSADVARAVAELARVLL